MRRLAITAALIILAAPAPLRAQRGGPQLQWFKWTPLILDAGRTDPVVLQVAITGSISRVVFELNPDNLAVPPPGSDYEMRDTGEGGDEQAGDGVYTVSLPATPLVTGLRANDVQRRFVGFARVYQESTVVLRANITVSMIDADVPPAVVVHRDVDVQSTDYVVNINDPAFFKSIDYFRIVKRVYEFFPDAFDFLNIVYQPSFFQNRFHFAVKNDVQGIGSTLFDNSAKYGSDGRLRGLSVFPLGEYFDGAETGFLHELGHQWINYLQFAPFLSGVPHWPVGSAATGIMGYGANSQGLAFGCRITEEAGGLRLSARTESPVFTNLDLYLMGLVPAVDVEPQLVFADQTVTAALCNGQLYTGPMTRVSINELIERSGARVPSADGEPKRWRVGTVIVSRDGLLADDAMRFYDYFASRMELPTETPTHGGFVKALGKPMPIATGGRASLDGRLVPLVNDFALEVSPGSVTVSRGQTSKIALTLRTTAGTVTSPVTFSCASLTGGGACDFSPSSTLLDASAKTITLTLTPPSVAGSYTVTVIASAGAVRRRITIQLVVQ